MAVANGVKIAVTVVALAGAGYLIWNHFQKQSASDVTLLKTTYGCTDCQNIFEMNQRQIADLGAAAAPTCPKCNKANTFEAFECQSCKKPIAPVGHGSVPKVCPLCKGKP
jgi:hypothetical protein